MRFAARWSTLSVAAATLWLASGLVSRADEMKLSDVRSWAYQ
jgi:hypothetical protein